MTIDKDETETETESPLTDQEREIIDYISREINNNLLLMTCLGDPDGSDFQLLMNNLIRKGYVDRIGSTYLGSITYKLTSKGESELPEISERDHKMRMEFGLSSDEIDILKTLYKLDRDQSTTDTIADELALKSGYMEAVTERLAGQGYLQYRGILLPKLQLTQKGENVIVRTRRR